MGDTERQQSQDEPLADDILKEVVGGVGTVDRDLRMPELFRRTLDNAVSGLAAAGDGPARPQPGTQFLEGEAALSDLVKMYRTALRGG